MGPSLHDTRTSHYSKETSDEFLDSNYCPSASLLGLFVLMTVPLFAMIALLVVALAAVAALVALTGAVLATPYLLGHSLLQRLRARRDASRHEALGARRTQVQLATGDPGWRTG